MGNCRPHSCGRFHREVGQLKIPESLFSEATDLTKRRDLFDTP